MLTISIDSTFIKIYVNIFSAISSSAATQAIAAAAARGSCARREHGMGAAGAEGGVR
jgi:hypothetical protein